MNAITYWQPEHTYSSLSRPILDFSRVLPPGHYYYPATSARGCTVPFEGLGLFEQRGSNHVFGDHCHATYCTLGISWFVRAKLLALRRPTGFSGKKGSVYVFVPSHHPLSRKEARTAATFLPQRRCPVAISHNARHRLRKCLRITRRHQ